MHRVRIGEKAEASQIDSQNGDSGGAEYSGTEEQCPVSPQYNRKIRPRRKITSGEGRCESCCPGHMLIDSNLVSALYEP